MQNLTALWRDNPTGRAGVALALAAAVLLPLILGGQWVKIMTSTACFTLAIAGVAFMYARLGMVNLAQIALMGVGGWVTLRLNHAYGWPFEVNLLAGGLVTMLVSCALAIPALRMRGLYLALVTLMAAGALEIIFGTFRFPNGGVGFWGVQTSFSAEFRRPWIAQSDGAYLSYTVIVVLLGFLLIEWHRRTAPGRAWAMIRRSEAAALAAGVDVTLYKTWAFAISGFLGGIGGGLLAGSLGLLDGGSFRASESILLFALAVVGGARFWLGAVIAAALYRILPALLNNWGVDADLAFVIFGLGLLHAVITAPEGIAGQILDALGLGKAATRATRQDASIVLENVSVRFGGVKALQDVTASFTQPVTGIIGPNGAGKTTLMNAFSGFVQASGKISHGGVNLTDLAPNARSRQGLRRSFQKEEIANDLTVRDNILVQLDSLGVAPPDCEEAIKSALSYVGLAGREDEMGETLNAYERRLVDLARCMVGPPSIIMLDEPAGGLSSDETDTLGTLIKGLPKATGAKVLLIDHDVDLIGRVCDETMVLDFGQLIAFGETKAVFDDPKVKAAYLGIEEEAAA